MRVGSHNESLPRLSEKRFSAARAVEAIIGIVHEGSCAAGGCPLASRRYMAFSAATRARAAHALVRAPPIMGAPSGVFAVSCARCLHGRLASSSTSGPLRKRAAPRSSAARARAVSVLASQLTERAAQQTDGASVADHAKGKSAPRGGSADGASVADHATGEREGPSRKREISDERIAQLRRFLAERRGETLAQPGAEIPVDVPIGSTGATLSIAEGTSGGFGARMWPSAKTLVDHISAGVWPDQLEGKRVLELGCGVGLGGLAAGYVGADVVLTDRDEAVLRRASENLQLNRQLIEREGGSATVAPLTWGHKRRMQDVLDKYGPFDFILGSDLLYSRASYGDLLTTIAFFSLPGHTRTWLACPSRDEGLGLGYGGQYFASVAAGHTVDGAIAKDRKMEHTAFELPDGTAFRSQLLKAPERKGHGSYIVELQLKSGVGKAPRKSVE